LRVARQAPREGVRQAERLREGSTLTLSAPPNPALKAAMAPRSPFTQGRAPHHAPRRLAMDAGGTRRETAHFLDARP